MIDLRLLSQLFDDAVALPAGERSAFARKACGEDAEMLRALLSLLKEDSQGDSPLDAPLPDFVAHLFADEPDLGHVGPYRLLREIGRGGMGVVYLAARSDGEFDKKVAVKLVKRGMDSDEILQRFRGERQILANLEHPGVARLYDGGMAPDGRPYFAMEFVEGAPITEYARSRRLSIHDRIELFDAAAAAVRFAHQNLIVHRDLKPSNVLVRDDGTVKLLDFGIARLLDPEGSRSDLTMPGHRVLTPAYAAPEQVEGAPATTAADVFSLGVLLHELLTGSRPEWKGDDPVPPSTTVSTTGKNPAPTPEVQELRQALLGDLDAILTKALERDPARRYGSVEALSEDLSRYRNGMPVSARAPTAGYRFGRFLRRNRLAVAAFAAAMLVLAAGSLTVLRQRDIARAERDAAETVTQYLEGMFESVNPVGRDPGADTLRIVDFLDRSTRTALVDLEDQPGLRGRLLQTLGGAHFSLGDFSEARRLWELSVAALEEAGDNVPADLVRDLGAVAIEVSDWEGADTLLANALEAAHRADRPSAVTRVLGLQARSYLFQGRSDDASAVLKESLPLLRAAGDTSGLADALYMSAGVERSRGEVTSALALQREGLDLFRKLRGPEDPQVAIGWTNLGTMHRETGALEAADTALRAALRIHQRRTPPGAPARLAALNVYATLQNQMGSLQRADSLYGVAAAEAAEAGQTRILAGILGSHSGNRAAAGDTAGALALAEQALDLANDVFGTGTPSTVAYLIYRAMRQDLAGDSVGAEGTLLRARTAAGDAIPERDIRRIIVDRGVGRGLSRQGRHAEAETLLLDVLARTPAGLDPRSGPFRERQATLRELVRMYDRWGRASEAARYSDLASAEIPGAGPDPS